MIGIHPTGYFCTRCHNDVEVDIYDKAERRKYNQKGWIMCYCIGTYIDDEDGYPDTWVVKSSDKLLPCGHPSEKEHLLLETGQFVCEECGAVHQ